MFKIPTGVGRNLSFPTVHRDPRSLTPSSSIYRRDFLFFFTRFLPSPPCCFLFMLLNFSNPHPYLCFHLGVFDRPPLDLQMIWFFMIHLWVCHPIFVRFLSQPCATLRARWLSQDTIMSRTLGWSYPFICEGECEGGGAWSCPLLEHVFCALLTIVCPCFLSFLD